MRWTFRRYCNQTNRAIFDVYLRHEHNIRIFFPQNVFITMRRERVALPTTNIHLIIHSLLKTEHPFQITFILPVLCFNVFPLTLRLFNLYCAYSRTLHIRLLHLFNSYSANSTHLSLLIDYKFEVMTHTHS